MPHKNVFNEDSILKQLPSPLNYNQDAQQLGFTGFGDKVKITVIGSGLPDHIAIKNIGKTISFSDSYTLDDTIGQSTLISGIIAANDESSMIGIAPHSYLSFAKVTNDDGKIIARVGYFGDIMGNYSQS